MIGKLLPEKGAAMTTKQKWQIGLLSVAAVVFYLFVKATWNEAIDEASNKPKPR